MSRTPARTDAIPAASGLPTWMRWGGAGLTALLLLTVARGGVIQSICALFRMAAQSGQDAGARSAPRTTGATAAAGSAGTLR